MDAFSLFDRKLEALVRQRFQKPTPIQKQAIPRILEGRDVLLLSETGSGKTETVLLPVWDQFLKKEHSPISILYITPLKSLNRDMLKRIIWWGEKLDFQVSVRHGDTSQYERSMQAQNPADMFISTPETLQSLLVGKIMRQHLKNVKWVVVDEIHELVDNKRGTQLSVGLARLRRLAGNFQLIGLSATVGSPEKVAGFLGGAEIIDAEKEKRIRIAVDRPRVSKEDAVASRSMFVSPETASRVRSIRDSIMKKEAVLVFTNTRESAEVLSSRLKAMDPGLKAETHHSSLSKEVRIGAEKGFRDRDIKALICTSSLELGIDIGAIDFVLQFMSPRQVSKLLQRVGRAGHSLSRVSEGMVMCGDADDCFESAVIARKSCSGEIESTQVYEKALDVLGHQIVGLTLEDYEIPLDAAYGIIRQAYPYKELTEAEFFSVCRLMERLGVIWINDRDPAFVERYRSGEIPKEDRFRGKGLGNLFLRRRKSAWVYYYGNLSTIPDVKSYKIHDVFTNQPVGSLDAEFIALHGSPGQGFIVKGQAWKILDVGESKVMVEPMAGIEAAIPAWEGELIPVPYEVAQEVGALRRVMAKSKDPVKSVMSAYPVSRAVARKLSAAVKEQQDWGFLPTDRSLLIEYDSEHIIFHTCFGSLVNDTIGRAMSVLLADRLGSVGLKTDPYRIVLKTSGWGWKEAAQAFMDMSPGRLEAALKDSLPQTELFHWRFLHVAQRFGIISRHADFGKGYLKKVVEAYKGSPAWEEAMREILTDKVAVEKAKEVIRLVGGELPVTIKEGISPMGKKGLERKHEIVAPDRPESEILGIFKKRLLETRMGLVCCNCGKWAAIKEAGKVPRKLSCPKCKSALISAVPKRYLLDAQQLVLKRLAGKKLSGEEQKWLDMTTDIASLVLASGRDAVIAMAGRGVGRVTAGRILAKMQTGDDLIRNVLEAERNFVKTKRFWK